MIRFLLLLFISVIPLQAIAEEEIVLGLSQSEVAITARFDGSDMLIFGAIKRETPIPEVPLEVIIAIEGPSAPITVRRKDRRFGIWVNTAELQVESAPAFYAVASSGPLDQVLDRIENERYDITVDRAIQTVSRTVEFGNTQDFTKALIRIQKENGSYQQLENAVAVDQQTLFRTSIALPSNLTEGDYRARIFLTRSGSVVSHFETVIDVHKVGLERFLYNLAHEQAPVYGLLSIIIAVLAGWGASTAFRLIRNG
ncbi:TIGR02186 family protein [Thalassovita aquimarina]|uniref:TIGR02186 family protein n=1 Tax=Thalassovita aquimarina TaxID=2785917 RepID=A0ABS5HPK4_9RHOB|nr:TIGR02186 family protein [Thalassovita aquimarina]MBR9650881.1 TIGR02186 family protein [Thalassovita aquimarina]